MRILFFKYTDSVNKLKKSSFVKNVFWNSLITVLERFAAVAQTILIARALGITEYGVYGLWFGTVGFIGSILGLQMGLTATVYLARYKNNNKEEAAAVIRHVYRYAIIIGLATLLLFSPFSKQLSTWLFQDSGYFLEVLVGLFFIGITIFSGVQDGILQGFEDFKSVSIIRALSVFVTLSIMYPIAKVFGLIGVLTLLLLVVVLKTIVMARVVFRQKKHWEIPDSHGTTRLGDIAMKFSIPSMLTSLLVGLATWMGSMLLSRQDAGFDKLAVVNIGLQWRGAILSLAGAVGTVAIPAFSRHLHYDTNDSAKLLKSRLLKLNFIGSIILAGLLIAISPFLLALYGQEFAKEPLLFSVLVISTIPQILANVYLQDLVGRGEMIRQLKIHIPVYIFSIVLFFILIPMYGGYGYALVTLLTAFLLYFILLKIECRKKIKEL